MSWREDELLAGLLAVLCEGSEAGRAAGVVLGPGDDAAIWQADGPVVATVDSVVAGVDWLVARTPAAAVGHRALAVNLSDLAAMGATPRGVLLALELPPTAALLDVVEAARGLRTLADAHGVAVLGGDLGCSDGPARWSVTALGTLGGRPLRRDAAEPGDALWLFGPDGASSAGAAAAGHAVLAALGEPDWATRVISRHRWPEPQVRAGIALGALQQRLAALDISDGLYRDAARMAAASRVRLCLQLPRPTWLSHELEAFAHERGLRWRDWVSAGGDDYCLLVAAAEGTALQALGGVRVGWVEAGVGVRLELDGCEVADAGGYSHGGRTGGAAVQPS